ncbi:hypothetical protein M422DRAFT_79906, partial [Sphaerobolus stellatus SS14]
IAQGGYAKVSKGKLGNEIVAIKTCKEYPDSNGALLRKRIWREALLWRTLRHPNIVPFYGIFTHQEASLSGCSLVSKWMENGTMQEYLEQTEKDNKYVNLADVASGLKYLHTHSPPVIHADVKPSNVLIDGAETARIGDFGISKVSYELIDKTKTTTTQSSGTWPFSAPEIFNITRNSGSPFTAASDVWAFGMLMWQAFTGRVPYDECGRNPAAVIAAIANKKKLPEFPLCQRSRERGFNVEVWKLMELYWNYDPKERPTMEFIESK